MEQGTFPEKFRETMNTIQMETSYKELDRTLWNVTVMASEEQRRILDEKILHRGRLGISGFLILVTQVLQLITSITNYLKQTKNEIQNTEIAVCSSVYKYLGLEYDVVRLRRFHSSIMDGDFR